ncbi:MAG TPA: hypothetical protein VHT68_19415 [Pseudolabrys sp.]|nr:hypothetical protein [Pseudolabrys sp.]
MSDIETVAMERLKALDPNRPIREADIDWCILVTRLFRQQVRERLFSRSGRPWHAFKKDG